MPKHSGKPGNYAYTVARVKAKKSKLLKEDDYNKMLQLSANEIARYISEAGYGREVTELASVSSGVDLVEHATWRNVATAFQSVLGSSQGELRDMVGAYLEKWDIWNLKVVVRGKTFGVDPAVLREDLVPAGRLDMDDLDKMVYAESVEDAIPIFCKMMLMNPADLSYLSSAYKNTENGIGDLGDALDRRYYGRLLSNINPSTRSGKMFQDYVRAEIDTKNLETILKLKAEGVYGDVVMKYYIPGGKEVSFRLASHFANEETVAGMVGDASGLSYSEFLKELVDNENILIRDVVHNIKKFEFAQAAKFSHMYPLSVVPVIDYMIHKESEAGNITTIARGIESGLDTETIKGLLVIRWR